MTKFVRAITTRTDAEWPADHPLRKGSVVMSNRQITDLEQLPLLICSLAGESRLPPSAGDADIEASCARCGAGIVYRRSSPSPSEKVCHPCWRRASGGGHP